MTTNTETIEQMAMRIAKEQWVLIDGRHLELEPIAFATRIRDELAKQQEPVAWLHPKTKYAISEIDAFNQAVNTSEFLPCYLHPAPDSRAIENQTIKICAEKCDRQAQLQADTGGNPCCIDQAKRCARDIRLMLDIQPNLQGEGPPRR